MLTRQWPTRPLIYVDPSGHKNENVILIGNVVLSSIDQEHDKNYENFIDSALELVKYMNKNNTHMLIDFTSYNDRAEEEGINGDNYIADLKNRFIKAGINESNIKEYRNKDHIKDLLKGYNEISQLHYFGHGYPDNLYVTYGRRLENYSINKTDINTIKNNKLFNEKGFSVFWTCRAAGDYQDDSVKNTDSFAYVWSQRFGVRTYGLDSRMNYGSNRPEFKLTKPFYDYNEVSGLPYWDTNEHKGNHWVEFNGRNDETKTYSHYGFLGKIGIDPRYAHPPTGLYNLLKGDKDNE